MAIRGNATAPAVAVADVLPDAKLIVPADVKPVDNFCG